MTTLSMTNARLNFSELANKVTFGHERIFIEKNGKAAFAMVPIKDIETLEALEDKLDAAAMRAVLKNPQPMSLSQAKKELGL